jgi:hypothetical protein
MVGLTTQPEGLGSVAVEWITEFARDAEADVLDSHDCRGTRATSSPVRKSSSSLPSSRMEHCNGRDGVTPPM